MILDQEKIEILSDIFNVTIHKDLPIEPGDLYFCQGSDRLFSILTCKEVDQERMIIIPTEENAEKYFAWNCIKVTRNKEED